MLSQDVVPLLLCYALLREAGRLSTMEVTVSWFWGLEVQHQGVSRAGFFGGGLLGLQMIVFFLGLHLVFPLCLSVPKFPLLMRTPVSWIRAHPNDLILT